MDNVAIRFEVLPAAHGDCLLIECPVGVGTWRMLIDTGPDETYGLLRERLLAVPPGVNGRRRIDLFVVTHIDHDHIGGAGRLLADTALKLDFGDVWFNAPGQSPTRSIGEGQGLADMLGAPGVKLPWNHAFGGAHAVTPDGHFLEVSTGAGLPRLTLLSPPPARLERLFKVWQREVSALVKPPQPRLLESTTRGAFDPDLVGLAAKKTGKDAAVANGSSIALLVEHRGTSVLMAADAFAPVLTTSLKALASHRGQRLPFAVDAFKLSHHGSEANITVDLFAAVQANHHVISTNGAIFGHPDDSAIARTILHGGRQPVLWFNEGSARNKRWASPPLQARHGFTTEYPKAPGGGVTLVLKAAG